MKEFLLDIWNAPAEEVASFLSVVLGGAALFYLAAFVVVFVFICRAWRNISRARREIKSGRLRL